MPFIEPHRRIDRVFLHCNASDDPDHDDIRAIRDWHVNGRDWEDVGYHYFIRKDGTLEAGRPLERTHAAQARPQRRDNRNLPARARGGELYRARNTGR